MEITDDAYRAKFLNYLNDKIELHPGQLKVAQTVFGGKNVVVSCGRKWGKSTAVQYIALRKAALFKKAYIYVTLPALKQAKEIYWDQLIIPEICHPDYISDISKGDFRITFKSGSFIKFDGSANPELLRGPGVHLWLPDELKDINPEVFPAMEPNLLMTRGTFAAFGTPPNEDQSPEAKQWFKLVDRHLLDSKTKYFQGSSEENPFANKQELADIKRRLLADDRADEWEREYCGRYERSTQESIFPTWSDKEHVFPTQDLLAEIEARREEMEFWEIQDPGSSSCFAQLFLAYHKSSATVYVLNESYVTDPRQATVLEMYRLEVEKCGEIEPDQARWVNLYDEQASWFPHERAQLGISDNLMPTDKNKWRVTNQEDLKSGLTTARDMLTYKRLKVADRCVNFISEVKGYQKKQIKKKARDHLIDCWRYFILKSFYTIPKEIIDDLSMVSALIKKSILESTKRKGLALEDLDTMIERDISEMFIAEAMEWDGW